MRKVIATSILAAGIWTITACGTNPKPEQVKATVANFISDTVAKDLEHCSVATFAAGCFWHEEVLFESIKGVKEAVSGYAGGQMANPTYEDIETGNTGHTETVNVYYDSSIISFPTLLKVFLEGQEDPTQVNGQGPDKGTQYRSAVFYRNDAERQMATDYIRKVNESKKYANPIAAEIKLLDKFWPAEDYHQNYVYSHTDNPYVANVSIPGVAAFQAKNPELIKAGRSFVNKK